MKNLIIFTFMLCMVGCASNTEVSKVAQIETKEQFMARMERQGTPVKETTISKEIMDQALALLDAQEKAGGARKYDEANNTCYEFIDQYRANPNEEGMNNILAFMKTTKIPLLTTAGLIYEPEQIKQIIESSVN